MDAIEQLDTPKNGWGFNPRARDGRDWQRWITTRSKLGFNPRARDGRDCSLSSSSLNFIVSIHAPVMDAIVKNPCLWQVVGFNPRARDGRDGLALGWWFS